MPDFSVTSTKRPGTTSADDTAAAFVGAWPRTCALQLRATSKMMQTCIRPWNFALPATKQLGGAPACPELASKSGNPGSQGGAETIEGYRPTCIGKREFGRSNHISLRDAFSHADARGGMLILLEAPGGKPHVKGEHLR